MTSAGDGGRGAPAVTDTELCALAAASYAEPPQATGVTAVVDWQDYRVVISGDVAAVCKTVPDSMQNWLRDFHVGDEVSRIHPNLGNCPFGALDAAQGLLPLIGTPRILTGHSLGGQVAVLLAGLLATVNKPPDILVTWDAPKAGGARLAAELFRVRTRQYRFRGSVVTNYPMFLDRHVRIPLFDIGEWTADHVEAHAIGRALAWLRANLKPAPTKGATP